MILGKAAVLKLADQDHPEKSFCRVSDDDNNSCNAEAGILHNSVTSTNDDGSTCEANAW